MAGATRAAVASQSGSIAVTTRPRLAAVAKRQRQIMEMRTRASSSVTLLFYRYERSQFNKRAHSRVLETHLVEIETGFIS